MLPKLSPQSFAFWTLTLVRQFSYYQQGWFSSLKGGQLFREGNLKLKNRGLPASTSYPHHNLKRTLRLIVIYERWLEALPIIGRVDKPPLTSNHYSIEIIYYKCPVRLSFFSDKINEAGFDIEEPNPRSLVISCRLQPFSFM